MASLKHSLLPGLAMLALAAGTGRADSPDYRITVLAGGAELEYSGAIETGSSGALRAALDENEGVRALHLKSNGGNVFYGRQMQNLVHERGLTTIVDQNCMSACALVFLGGQQRYLAPGAQLGFHRASAGGASQFEIDSFEESDAQFMRAMGISDAFVEKAFSTPSSDIWIPSIEELEKAHVIDGVSTKFARPPDTATAASLADQMLGFDPFKTLQTRDPQQFQALRKQATADMGMKASLTDVTELPGAELSPLALQYWSSTSDALALEFARSLESYLVRLGERNPDECYYLFFPARAPDRLPTTEVLSAREFGNFADVQARLIGYAVRHQTPVPKEADIATARDTMVRQFQEKAPGLLSVFSTIDDVRTDHGQACSAMTEMLALTLQLPDDQSGPLLRFIFQIIPG